MAVATASPAPAASPQLIGNAFVQQYYHILHQFPASVYKFYQDSSILSRPAADGVMTSVTTMQGINDKILSLDFSNCFTEIETVDSQLSYKDGVLIVVTGSFTERDNIRRKFTQSFFLAPQEHGGYFVLNDMLRLLNETQPREIAYIPVNGTNDDAPKAHLTPDTETTSQEHHMGETQQSDEDVDNNDEVLENMSSGVEDDVAVDTLEHPGESDVQTVSEASATTVVQDDMPKKSYASILKVTKETTYLTTVYAPDVKAVVPPANAEKQVVASKTSAHTPETSVPASNTVSENNNSHQDGGYSIYINNLPHNASAQQVEEEFKKFGTIKPGGIQVRSHKSDQHCFGFVEFDSIKSAQAAIEASPIMMGGYNVHVEEKKTTTRVVNGVVTHSGNGISRRGRFQQGRGSGFRNDSFRGRGGYGANDNMVGHRRTDNFRNRTDYNGWGHGPAPRGHGRGGDVYQQRAYLQNGNGRISRPNGTAKQPAAIAVQ